MLITFTYIVGDGCDESGTIDDCMVATNQVQLTIAPNREYLGSLAEPIARKGAWALNN